MARKTLFEQLQPRLEELRTDEENLKRKETNRKLNMSYNEDK